MPPLPQQASMAASNGSKRWQQALAASNSSQQWQSAWQAAHLRRVQRAVGLLVQLDLEAQLEAVDLAGLGHHEAAGPALHWGERGLCMTKGHGQRDKGQRAWSKGHGQRGMIKGHGQRA